jgi:2-polyprenyl-6-methoxyphenol hydroxylase-like FAD-dependent oxidoreductase
LVIVMRAVEGVVHALCNIHAALAPGAILVDTQPVGGHPPVAADGMMLGTLDLREWLDTIEAVDERITETLAAGLYDAQHERRFTVVDTFDDAPECLETMSSCRCTRVPVALATRIRAARPPLTVAQEVRLRLLRRQTPLPTAEEKRA